MYNPIADSDTWRYLIVGIYYWSERHFTSHITWLRAHYIFRALLLSFLSCLLHLSDTEDVSCLFILYFMFIVINSLPSSLYRL
jgi:hypothetical protein